MNYTLNIDNSHFPYPLVVEFIDGIVWRLVVPFKYITDSEEVITVPSDFRFDFASIPRPFWSLIGSPTGEYGPAATIHDFLCAEKPCPYSKIDYIFYEAMKNLGIPYLKRTIMYLAVRAFHIFSLTLKS